jgi:hypothetical protein
MSRLADDSQWELQYYGIRTEIEELALRSHAIALGKRRATGGAGRLEDPSLPKGEVLEGSKE